MHPARLTPFGRSVSSTMEDIVQFGKRISDEYAQTHDLVKLRAEIDSRPMSINDISVVSCFFEQNMAVCLILQEKEYAYMFEEVSDEVSDRMYFLVLMSLARGVATGYDVHFATRSFSAALLRIAKERLGGRWDGVLATREIVFKDCRFLAETYNALMELDAQ